ncbi:hypothetical protein PF002_g12452 [Phytophthora fragariae]|uniref:Uncharacterized protein n=1 Tax=Phytophthora fragariae TaxID=53985 RepID=A0A6A3ZD08_9STRA|nr:hypothetical protein PF002_g12452 [Phytophthora fragariae]
MHSTFCPHCCPRCEVCSKECRRGGHFTGPCSDTRPVSALRAHDETGCIGCVKVARIRKRGKRQIASRVVLPRGGKGRSHRSSPQLPRVKERSRGQLRYPPFLLI